MIKLPKVRGRLVPNQLLAPYTSWKLGGAAQYFFEPADLTDLQIFLQNCGTTALTVLGAGSNVLIRDQGICGTVIYLRNNLNELQTLGDIVQVAAGVPAARLVAHCVTQGFAAAFLAGIPGTVGGLLAMNAGAYGASIWHYVRQVVTIKRDGTLTVRFPHEFQVGYRQVLGLAPDEWFVAVALAFPRQAPLAIKELVQEILAKRRATQPLDKPSCGSVFRNPPGKYAASLIETAGLKGKRIGGAKVAVKHANFILNEGGATAQDVLLLMQHVVTEVQRVHQVVLIPEVQILGEAT